MGLLIDNIRKAREGCPYNAEYGERVSIDPERIRKAREINKEAKEGGLAPTLTCMDNLKKSPLGLMPKEIHDWKRIVEIVYAMEQYAEAGIPIDKEWVVELKQLLKIT